MKDGWKKDKRKEIGEKGLKKRQKEKKRNGKRMKTKRPTESHLTIQY